MFSSFVGGLQAACERPCGSLDRKPSHEDIKKNHTKWMTTELSNLISSRDMWFEEYTDTKDPAAFRHYKTLRNRVNHAIAKAKRDFYKRRYSQFDFEFFKG